MAVSQVSQPNIRAELLAYVRELSGNDPRVTWAAEREQGLISGIDEAIHFFFDDHDFDERDIGWSLRSVAEAEALGRLKLALSRLVDALPKGGDDDYVGHPAWPGVAMAAKQALTCLTSD